MALFVFFHSFLELQLRLTPFLVILCCLYRRYVSMYVCRCGSIKLWEDTDRVKEKIFKIHLFWDLKMLLCVLDYLFF
ncbi:hypothetical protein ERO13_A06G053951v2 [Gossypium hirsutum]|uniref:Uncharacterized protein n=1 Tax=Gossypium barbadense TaxID=3634 RepID=A0A5J5VA11_GOSBA|nr:hypothetical protein ES319_A06G060500v1 [Gossypium barbadense]KAG4194455.1 hypothetical protein ERO13_A06G053951v2 [Gossypium hirsutum]